MRSRAIRRRFMLIAWVGFVLGALVLLGPVVIAQRAVPEIPRPDFSSLVTAEVVRIVDGDTIVIRLGREETTVRLIGVDTPETVHPRRPVEAYGKEASRFLTNLLAGESVYIESEPGNPVDRYGRTLGYLYRVPDGLFVNLEIVRQGYGHAYTKYPFEHIDLFRFYETKAREAGRGLWGDAADSM
jgi:micrococcal nuclease